jgi:hypothetical protein
MKPLTSLLSLCLLLAFLVGCAQTQVQEERPHFTPPKTTPAKTTPESAKTTPESAKTTPASP